MARLRRVLLAPTPANWLDAYGLILRRRRWRTVRLDILFPIPARYARTVNRSTRGKPLCAYAFLTPSTVTSYHGGGHLSVAR